MVTPQASNTILDENEAIPTAQISIFEGNSVAPFG
jgi:hypothetical protein